ncbi:hypothetical protein BRETT_000078 [Brettanomyces bruxellensis]|uniref:3',5'-cyclic-nucleotide phosphodiesterase n=1 Tax=Dekkera bruxellensis TaxID=5007 RepID=A0A871R5D3_DEKBR|nr:uncharacterized protein BRETT_000078 [Brettanomyces bruxellensis]QOU18352.1 hypothetical protein BRETT_000078 [Brettanomyces bruxellensis]
MPTNHKRFELSILGCSGGPISSRTCAYLLKPANISYSEIILSVAEERGARKPLLAIDAGAGLTAISELVLEGDSKNPKDNFIISIYDDHQSQYEEFNFYQNTGNLEVSHPFACVGSKSSVSLAPLEASWKIINSITAYLITHPHLDHLSGLVINSPSFKDSKDVYGLPQTMNTIRSSLFNGHVWPDLISEGLINLHEISPYIDEHSMCDFYNVECFPVAHGDIQNGRFLSSAFLITDKLTQDSIIIFGDLESDYSSSKDYNRKIWELISPLVLKDKLNTIIIECSTIDKPPPLYGHMTPTSLIRELLALRKYCFDKKFLQKTISHSAESVVYIQSEFQPLKAMNVIVTHVKEVPAAVNPRTLIFRQLNDLNCKYALGINFTIALPGLSYIL